jgi:Ala-tRNA(Pro) deacylase
MQLTTGRPANMSGRLDKEVRVYDLLDQLQMAYQYVDHEAAESMTVCEAIEKELNLTICKNLFLCNRQQTKFYLLMIRGDKVFKTKEISSQINSPRLSFASSERMAGFLDITPGSVSVMGLMNDTDNNVSLLIDSEILSDEYFGCHPCINTTSLKIKASDLLDKFLPAVHHDYTEVYLTGE